MRPSNESHAPPPVSPPLAQSLPPYLPVTLLQQLANCPPISVDHQQGPPNPHKPGDPTLTLAGLTICGPDGTCAPTMPTRVDLTCTPPLTGLFSAGTSNFAPI